MSKYEKMPYEPRVCWLENAKFDKYGREIPDHTQIEMPSDGFEAVSSMDLKMQYILQEMLAKMQVPEEETVLDDTDFDLPDESLHTKYNDYATKDDFLAVQKEVERVEKLSKQQKKQQTDDGEPVVRKAAKPARAKRVEVDQYNPENELADDES